MHYVLGLAKNDQLKEGLGSALAQAKAHYEHSGEAARVLAEFPYRTRKSWSRERRVIGKAEYLAKGANPRFVVTTLRREEADAQCLYEQLYCARGEMENRNKEQQLALFADRTGAATLRANQIRLYFASFAHVLMSALRRLGLVDTQMAHAQCETIRLKLLKIGARVTITVRRVWLPFSEACPHAALFTRVLANLGRWPPYAPAT